MENFITEELVIIRIKYALFSSILIPSEIHLLIGMIIRSVDHLELVAIATALFSNTLLREFS